jgi:hypothetical protein
MKDLVQDRLPHAPHVGLFVVPHIPEARLANALNDYAHHVKHSDVLALYDATLSGNAKDGAVFARDRFVFQNTDLEAPQTVRYRDLVGVETHSRWMGLGGKKVDLTVNRGRATFDLTMVFSGQPGAAEHVAAFLETAMLHDLSENTETGTDVAAVRDALQRLYNEGKLSEADLERLLNVL